MKKKKSSGRGTSEKYRLPVVFIFWCWWQRRGQRGAVLLRIHEGSYGGRNSAGGKSLRLTRSLQVNRLITGGCFSNIPPSLWTRRWIDGKTTSRCVLNAAVCVRDLIPWYMRAGQICVCTCLLLHAGNVRLNVCVHLFFFDLVRKKCQTKAGQEYYSEGCTIYLNCIIPAISASAVNM